ncbi:MAG: phenylalanine--tRNA ligase subunit beta [Myxococcales bacterium]|jgi:phenylalanyl-tRNA synthetase beta chain|nr:phenylalanine--tRNA ligase subunit beta [Myxococcales bacterium]
MKISLNWLSDYVDLPETPEALAALITMAGLEVEGIEQLGQGLDGVVVARILESAPHPSAEKLSVNQVDVGTGERLQIVCGAKNFAVGDLVPLATIGAALPNGIEIKQAALRGVASFGMLCSARELGISDDHAGLLILDPSLKLGMPIADALGLGDTVFEVNVTPNRGDCLSHIGIAREVAALTGRPLKIPKIAITESAGLATDTLLDVRIDAPERCRRYAARIAEGVRIGPSPLWMQNRLRAVGVRPISNAVDVTNFVMFECGQPLHAFDFDKVAGGQIVVRLAKPNERMTTLDGKERVLAAGDDLCICDATAPSALAGVMGGGVSEISDATTRVLIEAAWFEPGAIRRTARRHALHSESSHRFERGIDPEMLLFAQDRTAQLLAELAGAKILPGRVDRYPRPFVARHFDLHLDTPSRTLGMPVERGLVKKTLSALGFGLSDDGRETVEVTIPSWRPDVEGEADCVEELARTMGYDKIPARLPCGVQELPDRTASLRADAMNRLRAALAAAGLDEVINYSFVDAAALAHFTPDVKPICLRNAIAADMSAMATSRLPGLVNNLKHSLNRQVEAVRLYEIGRVYVPELPANLATAPMRDALKVSSERQMLSGLVFGPRAPLQWAQATGASDFYDLKGAIELVLSALNLRNVRFESTQRCDLHPRSACALMAGDVHLGLMGELHPTVATAFDVPRGVYLFELDLDALLAAANPIPRARPIPRYPAVLRDLAIVVDAAAPAADVEAAIRTTSELVESVTLFDVFRGGSIQEDKKSLAFAIRYRDRAQTLTDEQVNAAHQAILTRLGERFGAELR